MGEKTYLLRYFNSGYCTAIVCLSPTDTDVIADDIMLFYGSSASKNNEYSTVQYSRLRTKNNE
jgi:hypothetical protein